VPVPLSWIWLAGGILLCAAEALAPGVFLIWIGVAAAATGLVLFAAPLAFEWQLLLFAALVGLAVASGRRIYLRAARPKDQPFLNRRAEGLAGRLVVLIDPIENGAGQARIDDTIWRVSGPDMPAGARVRVTGVAGAGLLRVEPA
jgi:hypothetical protein